MHPLILRHGCVGPSSAAASPRGHVSREAHTDSARGSRASALPSSMAGTVAAHIDVARRGRNESSVNYEVAGRAGRGAALEVAGVCVCREERKGAGKEVREKCGCDGT